MHIRFLLILLPLMAGMYPSFASAHGGGHAHHSSHSHSSFHGGHGASFHSHNHYHYHPAYHSFGHRSVNGYEGQREYVGVGRAGGSVYMNPLRGTQEFSASTGMVSATELEDATVKLATPNFFVTYKYYFSPGVAIGLAAGVQSLLGNGVYQNSNAQNMPFNYSETNITLAGELTWLYCSRGLFQAYGSAGLGITHYLENDHDQDNTRYLEYGDKLGYQVTPIGLRFGRAFGGFIEFGAGYKGIVSGGLSYQGGRRKMRRM